MFLTRPVLAMTIPTAVTGISRLASFLSADTVCTNYVKKGKNMPSTRAIGEIAVKKVRGYFESQGKLVWKPVPARFNPNELFGCGDLIYWDGSDYWIVQVKKTRIGDDGYLKKKVLTEVRATFKKYGEVPFFQLVLVLGDSLKIFVLEDDWNWGEMEPVTFHADAGQAKKAR